MAQLRAYFDASKTNPIGVTAVGGHIADDLKWMQIEHEWRDELQFWGLKVFHLTDIPSILGHEKGALCVRAFARLVSTSQLHGITAGMRDADWDGLMNEPEYASHRSTFPSRYHAVLDMLFAELGQFMELNYKDDSVSVTVDTDYEPLTYAQAIFDEYANGRYVGRLSSLTFSRASASIPLQIADLAVGLQRREWAKRGFLGEQDAAWGPMTIDQRAVHWSQGRTSNGVMWSNQLGEIARKARERVRMNAEKNADGGSD